MKRYVALLRGINVSGKNMISMIELKKDFEKLDFTEVVTYINSGNIAFSSVIDDMNLLTNKIVLLIKDKFNLNIPVLILLQEDIEEILKNAPTWWGNDDTEIYDNLIFLLPSLSYEEFYEEIGNPNEEYEKVYNYKNVVFWSFTRKYYQKTNWWSKTANANISDKFTIRTANTVRKIASL